MKFTAARLREYVFFIWVGFWCCSCLVLFLAPLIDRRISSVDVPEAVFTVSGIWVPILGCFAGFWFLNPSERRKARIAKVTAESARGALVCTVLHLLLIFIFVIYQTYVVNSGAPEYGASSLPPNAPSFPERIVVVVRWATLTSPFGTAPVLWLTGRDVITNEEGLNGGRGGRRP